MGKEIETGKSRKRRKRREKRGFLTGKVLAALGGLAVVLAVAGGLYISFAGWPSAPGASGANLPRYARSNPVIQLAYQYALDSPNVLAYIPCYCGCGEHDGHQSNWNCFITGVDKQQQIVFEEHGST